MGGGGGGGVITDSLGGVCRPNYKILTIIQMRKSDIVP